MGLECLLQWFNEYEVPTLLHMSYFNYDISPTLLQLCFIPFVLLVISLVSME